MSTHNMFSGRNKKISILLAKKSILSKVISLEIYLCLLLFIVLGLNISVYCCLLCWGLTSRQPMWVIFCHLPEKGRRDIEEREENK